MTKQTLVRHTDIQKWANAHRGQPAIQRIADTSGTLHPRLTLRFARAVAPQDMPGLDEGVSPVSWSAWLAELDRQNLALRVGRAEGFEFIDRRERH